MMRNGRQIKSAQLQQQIQVPFHKACCKDSRLRLIASSFGRGTTSGNLSKQALSNGTVTTSPPTIIGGTVLSYGTGISVVCSFILSRYTECARKTLQQDCINVPCNTLTPTMRISDINHMSESTCSHFHYDQHPISGFPQALQFFPHFKALKTGHVLKSI